MPEAHPTDADESPFWRTGPKGNLIDVDDAHNIM